MITEDEVHCQVRVCESALEYRRSRRKRQLPRHPNRAIQFGGDFGPDGETLTRQGRGHPGKPDCHIAVPGHKTSQIGLGLACGHVLEGA